MGNPVIRSLKVRWLCHAIGSYGIYSVVRFVSQLLIFSFTDKRNSGFLGLETFDN
jgi:hypothetical protein